MSASRWHHLVNAYRVKTGVVDWSGVVLAGCMTWVQLYVNACNWMAAICAAGTIGSCQSTATSCDCKVWLVAASLLN